MSHPLDGCRLKLERAEQHRQMLNGEFQRYWSSDAHEVVTEADIQKREVILRVKVNEPPDPMWSIIIGEWAHDLRSALDYIAWELADDYSGPAPDPVPKGKVGSTWRGVQFPIFTDPDEYSCRAPRMVALIDPAHSALIEAEQPYNRGKGALALLADLSNIDKHRQIHLIAGHVWAPSQSLGNILTTDCVVLSTEIGASGPVEDGAELGRIELQITGPHPQVQVNYNFMFGVTFAEPTSTWDQRLSALELMTIVGSDVREIVERFAPRLP